MRLILQKDVKNLGKTGDQVLVKDGYARNFLVPKGYALPLNKSRLKVWKHQQVIISAKKRKAVAERKALIEKLSSIKLNFEKESLKDGKLFGSVTNHEMSQALEKLHNISVDKRDISPSILKTVGDHTVTIRLDLDNKTDIPIKIKGKTVKKEEESKLAKSQEKEDDKAVEHKEEEKRNVEDREKVSVSSEKSQTSPKKSMSFLERAKMSISLKSKPAKTVLSKEDQSVENNSEVKKSGEPEIKDSSSSDEDSK